MMNLVPEIMSFPYIAETCGQIPIDISVQNYEFRADGLSIKCEQVLWCFGTYIYIAKCPAGGNDGHESFYGWDWLRARVKRNNFPHK